MSAAAREAIDEPANDLFFSHVSVWEIFNKSQAGKLKLPKKPRVWVDEQLAARGVADFAIDLASLGRMSELPLHHRDPFDRLLVAQCLVHGLSIVSPDEHLPAYGVTVVW